MRDGNTRVLRRTSEPRGFEEFLAVSRARIVMLSGPTMGATFELDEERVTMGRGPGVGVAFDNPLMARQHAAIDYVENGFRITDLGSTNGLYVKGKPVRSCDIAHGDRFEMGGQEFQLVVEEREDEPDTYELPVED